MGLPGAHRSSPPAPADHYERGELARRIDTPGPGAEFLQVAEQFFMQPTGPPRNPMDVRMPMITSERDGDLMTRRPAAILTSEHTLKIEAARAGVGVGEYQARLRQGLLWCYRCQDWHQADAFPADARRHSGRAGSCHQAIRAGRREALPS